METYQKLYNKNGVPCGMNKYAHNIIPVSSDTWFGELGVCVMFKNISGVNAVFDLYIYYDEEDNNTPCLSLELYADPQNGRFLSYSPTRNQFSIHTVDGEASDLIIEQAFQLQATMISNPSYDGGRGPVDMVLKKTPNHVDYVII